MKIREGKQKTGLRSKAEKQLKSKRKPPADLSTKDAQKLIHELEVHQIELELQNEELRETQYELEVSRNRYVDLYDFAPVGYCTLDKKGMILEVNLVLADLFGVERQNLMKKRFNYFITPDFQDIFHKHCGRVFNNTVRQSCTLQCKKKDGTLFYVQLESKAEQARPSHDNTMQTAVIDITEQIRAEDALKDSEELYRLTLDSISDATFITDDKGVLTFISPNVNTIFGYSCDELKAFGTISKLIGTGLFKARELKTKGEIANIERDIMDKSGRGHSLLINVKSVNIKGGKILYTCHDITERKQAQEALKQSYDALEQRVNERTASFQRANEQLHIEIVERRQVEEKVRINESRLEAMLKLSEMSEATITEIADFVCEELVKLTQSTIGFLGFINHDESVMILHAYSKSVMEECTVAGQLLHFPIEKAGIWGEVIRKKESLIVNDYSIPNPYKKGYPEGHVRLLRFIIVPVMNGKRVVAIATVGNKETYYNTEDLRQLKLLMEGMNEIIERKQMQDELKQSEMRLQSLSAQLLTSQESERKRVSQELHDSVGQTLSALKFRVENATKQLGEKLDYQQLQVLRGLLPQIQESIIEVNRIGRGLRPSMLDDLGVLSALSWFCREFKAIYPDIHIKQEIALEEDDIPENCKVVIYRVLQESLNNIAKHSKADIVELFVKKTNTTLEFSIKDNGKGFDMKHVLLRGVEDGGLGLAGMMKRVDMSGGVCKITSKEKRGTQVKALWQV